MRTAFLLLYGWAFMGVLCMGWTCSWWGFPEAGAFETSYVPPSAAQTYKEKPPRPPKSIDAKQNTLDGHGGAFFFTFLTMEVIYCPMKCLFVGFIRIFSIRWAAPR